MNSQTKIIFLIGRDNWQQDDTLNHVLIEYLKKTKHEIRWEDPAGNILYKLRRFERNFKWLPIYLRKINLRFFQLVFGLFHWSYFNYLSDRRNLSVNLRTRRLKKSILELGDKKEIIILSRSAGGRFSSRIADELKIKQIICLSYPFKHPQMDIDPDRYLHLADLKTPMLIIQGERDEYGGLEVKDNYRLSPNIELFFVDATHDFKIDDNDWKKVLTKISEVLDSN